MQRFNLTSHSASTYVQPWILPTFEDLQQVPAGNPLLSSLTMPIDSRSSVPNASTMGSQAMKSLTLHLYPSLRGQMGHDGSLRLSLFLDQLFPSVTSLTSNFEPASPQKSVWKPIKELLDAYQSVRSRALQNAAMFSSP